MISDVHGNLPALRSTLEDIRADGLDRLCFLGDIVNGVSPRECVAELMDWQGELVCVKGNAEDMVCVRRLTDFPWRNDQRWNWVVPKVAWWREQLSPEQRAFVCRWPDRHALNGGLAVHHSPVDDAHRSKSIEGLPDEFVRLVFHGEGIPGDETEEQFRENLLLLKEEGFDSCFFGHTHQPWTITVHGVMFCNVGSAGMPLDGDPRASWVAWRAPHRAKIHRVDYDLEDAIARIARSDMPGAERDSYAEMFQRARHHSGLE